jgi:hypothetical protein
MTPEEVGDIIQRIVDGTVEDRAISVKAALIGIELRTSSLLPEAIAQAEIIDKLP